MCTTGVPGVVCAPWWVYPRVRRDTMVGYLRVRRGTTRRVLWAFYGENGHNEARLLFLLWRNEA